MSYNDQINKLQQNIRASERTVQFGPAIYASHGMDQQTINRVASLDRGVLMNDRTALNNAQGIHNLQQFHTQFKQQFGK